LRSTVVAGLLPLASDVVLAGSGREFVAALVFPDLAACRRLDPALPADASASRVLESSIVRQHFQQRLDDLAAAGTGSASRVVRMSLETEPATLDSGEMTPKFALSAAAVLRRRASTVDELFAEPPGQRVLVARQA
jgi:feruloyl-CoA synthase